MPKPIPEILTSCPKCGRKNFTERGLKAHVCKGSGTALAVVENKPIDLDRLKSETVSDFGNSFRFDAKLHGERVVAMLQHIEGLKKERVVKSILAGMYLAQVKAALGHGQFETWAAKHLGKSVRTGRYYMALAGQFSRSSKLLLPELVGANQLSLDLTNIKDDGGKAVLAKLEKFAGDKGLTELLQKYQIIKRGGNQRPALPAPAPATNGAAADKKSAEEQMEEAAMSAFEMCIKKVDAARKALLDELVWADLTVESAKLIEAKLKQALNAFQERIQQARHERA